ncbi:transglutaminase TgpA family protein [Lactiplantibacillus fabifermentans]|nr:transglutaminaseTgpA domain-containing protein [Lactiplantibacillus fabifermentans]
MMPKQLKLAIVALLNALLLAVPLMTYTTVNHFSRPYPLLAYLAAISLITWAYTCWPRHPWRWWLLYVISFVAGSYASFPFSQALSVSWLTKFCGQLLQQMRAFQSGSAMMPVLLSMLLIMALAIALTLLTVRWRQPFLCMLVSSGYLLAVTIFATRNEVLPLALTTGLTVLLILVLFLPHWSWQTTLYTGLMILVIAGGATVNTWAKTPLNQLAKQTVNWRNSLSSSGFYTFLEKSSAVKKTGYSSDTSTLGGAIQDDNSVAFKAIAAHDQYWRVDTRDDYSGKGWNVDKDTKITRKPTKTSTGYIKAPTTTAQKVTLTMSKTTDYLPVGYGQTTWALSSKQQSRIGVGYTAQRGRVYINLGKHPVTKLTYTAQHQKYTAKRLQAVTAKPEEELDETYTQLPEDLPKRITTLSKKIIKGQTTEYGKVRALVAYLKTSNKYVYTKIDTPTTPSNRDYVDYFLFTTKRGYCDNFSTALVVMLRSVGIPARWAQGFSGGTRGSQTSDGRYHYSILNSDAHSWAEVYFAGIGWVPFDPTPGYQNPGTTAAKTKTNTLSTGTSQSTTTTKTTNSSSATSRSSSTTTTTSSTGHFHLNTSTARIITGSCILILMLAAWLGRFWLGLQVLRGLVATHTGQASWQYRQLRRWFEHQLPRAHAETLTAYAARVEQAWPQLHGQFMTATQLALATTFSTQPASDLPAALQTVIHTLQKNRKFTAPHSR